MAIFSNTKSMYDVPACEGYNFETCGHYDALMESLEDDLAITKAMHAFDMAEITGMRQLSESYTQEDLQATLEASSNGIFATIKAKVKELWAKIKAFFGSIFRFLTSFFKSGDEFIKANDAALKKVMGKNGKFKMKTYKYDFDELTDDSEDLDEYYKFTIDIIDDFKTSSSKEDIDKSFDELFGEKFNEQASDELDAWARKVRGLNKDDKLEKTEIEIDNSYLTKCYTFLKDVKNTTKKINAVKAKSDKVFNNTLKKIDELEKAAGEGQDIYVYAAKKAKDACTKFNNVMTKTINMQLTAIKEATTECKKVCLKAITLFQRSGESLK